MTLYFELEENPTGTAQQKGEAVRGGRIHHFEKENVRKQRAIYTKKIVETLENIGREPPHYSGPVFLTVDFFFSIKDRRRWGFWKDSAPDCDNVVKLLQDVLADIGFFEKGDQQVANLRVRKHFAEFSGIHIEIGRLLQP